MTGEGLSPTARALLDAARDGLGPDVVAIERMRGKVASATATSATAAVAVKLGLIALVATLAAGAALYGNHARSLMPPRIELPTAQAETIAPVVRRVAPPVSEIEMAPLRRTRPDHARGAAPTLTVAARSADLSREVELVDLAMAALRRGDTASALRAIRTHTAETRGTGQLAEDAAAIEIEALCRGRDPSVAAKLEVFDARFPRSAQRSRLSTTCP